MNRNLRRYLQVNSLHLKALKTFKEQPCQL
jgi:hypothetical protein